MNIREWLKASRTHAKMTLEEVGIVVDRTKATISGWEKGANEPSYWQILAIWEHTKRAIPLPTLNDVPVEIADRLNVRGQPSLRPMATRLVDEIAAADQDGMPEGAFEVLRKTLRMFDELRRGGSDDLAPLNEPTPTEE